MAVQGTCPSCGAKAPLDHFVNDQKYRVALAAAFATPAGIASLVLPYLGLFAPTTGRAVRADKLARVCTEFKDLVTSAEVTRNRNTYAAPLELWRAGIESVLAARDTGSLILPLDSHAYLTEVVWRLARKATTKRETTAPVVSHASHKRFEDRPEERATGRSSAAEVDGLRKLIAASKGEARTNLEAQLAKLEAAREGKA